MKRGAILAACLALAACGGGGGGGDAGSGPAPSGAFDPSFGTDGKVVLERAGSFPTAMSVAADGSIVLSGFPTEKLDARGALDLTFGDGGRYRVYPTYAALSDGMGGLFAGSGGPGDLMHIDARGRLDLEFGINGFATFPSGGSSAFTDDGEGALVGARYGGNPGPTFASEIQVAKLDRKGRPLASFGQGGQRTIALTQWSGSALNGLSIAADATGSVYVAGIVREPPAVFVVKLDRTGNWAADYVGGGIWVGPPCGGPPGYGAPALAVDASGSVFVGANCLPAGPSAGPGIIKLDPRGMAVAGFRDIGREPGVLGAGVGKLRAIAVRPNGDIYAVGQSRNSASECPEFVVAKLQPSGERATNFAQGGIVRLRDRDGDFRYLAFDGQGRVYAGGETEGDCSAEFGGPPFGFVIYRLTP